MRELIIVLLLLLCPLAAAENRIVINVNTTGKLFSENELSFTFVISGDENITSWGIEWGDRNYDSGQGNGTFMKFEKTHVYDDHRDFTITMLVTYNDSSQSFGSREIHVSNGPAFKMAKHWAIVTAITFIVWMLILFFRGMRI